MKITENDLHLALEKTGNLPENEFKSYLNNYHSTKKNNFIDEKQLLFNEIKRKILPNLKLYLNKSLTQILKQVRNHQNTELFENFSEFWLKFEDELLNRTEHLTNEQIIVVVDAFSKSKLECDKLFEEFEDLITESEIPFSVTLFINI